MMGGKLFGFLLEPRDVVVFDFVVIEHDMFGGYSLISTGNI